MHNQKDSRCAAPLPVPLPVPPAPRRAQRANSSSNSRRQKIKIKNVILIEFTRPFRANSFWFTFKCPALRLRRNLLDSLTSHTSPNLLLSLSASSSPWLDFCCANNRRQHSVCSPLPSKAFFREQCNQLGQTAGCPKTKPPTSPQTSPLKTLCTRMLTN